MMKWFRKHNKQLLAVFASALLVIWLGGSALERMFAHNPFTEPVGTAMGHKINASQHGALKTKLNLMESLGLPWYAPWANQWVKQQFGNMNEQQAQMLMMTMGQPLSREKGATDWWLLDLEARKMGVTISQQQVEDFLVSKGATGTVLNQIRDNFNLSTEELFSAVAEYLRVSQAAVLASAGVQVTEPEVKDVFVNTHDQLKVNYAVLPAESFAKDAAATQPANEPIPEAELQALFEKYRDQMPGPESKPYGFGYKIADREIIEYTGGTVQEIADTLPPISEERARKYFEQKKSEFQPPRPPTTQPTTQPAVAFEAVKDKVVDRLRKQEAGKLLRDAVENIRIKSWEEFSAAKDNLKDDKVPATLTKIMQQQAEEYKQTKRTPLTYTRTGSITQEQARKEPGIGIAGSLDAQGRPMEFATAAFNLVKDEAATKDADAKRDEKLQIRQYQPVVVRSQSGEQLNSTYVFRVVGFEPAHAPASLAEVREQVEKDARTLRALKKAEEAARQLAAAAEKGNFKEAFNAQFPVAATQPATTQPYGGDNAMKMLENQTLTRKHGTPVQMMMYMQEAMMPITMPGMVNPEPFVKATFDLAGPATTTQPVNKVTVIELPEQKAWVVAQVVEHIPAKMSEFESQKGMLAAEMRLLKLRSFYGDWFNAANIRERTNWQPVKGMITE